MTAGRAVLRRARPGDAAAIARVHVETWRATYAGLLPDAYLVAMTEAGQSATWRRILAGGDHGNLVAEVDGLVVGFGSCGGARLAEMPFKGEVYALYVAIDWQGQGLGRRLLEGLFSALMGARVPSAYLWVLAGNPSRFFYETLGGTRFAERQESFAGTLLDEVAYGWPDLGAW